MLKPALATAILVLAVCLPAQSVPSTMPFQGKLTLQGGGAVSAAVAMTFRIWSAATAGTQRWRETHSSVAVNKGLFKAELGSVTGFPPTLFDGKPLYLSVQVGTDAKMLPRLEISSQAYAQLAKNAMDVNSDIHPKSVSIGTTPVITNVIRL